MCDEKMKKRVLLQHYWKKGFNAAAASREINDVEGDETVSYGLVLVVKI